MELTENIKTRLDEIREEMEADNPDDDEDENKPVIMPRIPDDLLAEAFRWKLKSNDCRNRGFVLDGWPKNYE